MQRIRESRGTGLGRNGLGGHRCRQQIRGRIDETLPCGSLHDIRRRRLRREIAHQLPGLDDPGALNVSESEVHEGPSSLSRVRARKPMSRLSRLVLQTPEDRAEPRR